MKQTELLALLTTVLLSCLTWSCGRTGQNEPQQEEVPVEEQLPADFEQILERGSIASVDEPVFVSAQEAEITDDAWIFGVVIEGQAKAYSLNLLNRHEVVNDTSGGAKFAAVW